MKTLDRYALRETVGRGGFATVHRAWDPALGRDVALKVLLPHLADDAGVRRRFLAEARVIARLRHPNIVVVYDVGESERTVFFAMELVDGETLARRTRDGRALSLEETGRVLAQLGAAVDYLHDRGLVHRDIKAANIMCDRSGRVVLMDFGIARVLEETAHTQGSGVLGTPVAMAPEQVRGEPAGPAADIYALGVLGYQLLAGEPPFTGDIARVLHAHAYDPPPPLRRIRPRLPEHVYTAVDAALAKEPADRPARAAGFAAMLVGDAGESVATASPAAGSRFDVANSTVTRPVSIGPHRTERSGEQAAAGRSRGILAAVALLVLILVAGATLLRGGADGVTRPTAATGPTEDGETPAPSAAPAVANLRVYDNVFSRREVQFGAGDSVAACFALTPGADAGAIVVVATAAGEPPRDAGAPSVVARSEPVPPRTAEDCYAVRVLKPPLPAGSYTVWVLHGATILGSQGFVATAKTGDLLLADNFDDPTRGVLPQVSLDPAAYRVGYIEGSYVIEKADLGYSGVPFVLLPGTYENASLAVDVRLVGSTADRYIALGCRNSSPSVDNGYRLTVNPERGVFLLDRWQDGAYTPLVESRVSPAIRRGSGSNRLELSCTGGTIAVAINGSPVAAVEDAAHRQGQMWIGVESDARRRHTVQARFDNLVVLQQ